MEGDDRRDAVLPAGGALAAVVVEGGGREQAFFRLDPGPLDAEAIGVEAELGEEGDVVAVPVVLVAGVAARLRARRAFGVLEGPPVAVPVAALDLMGRGGGAPHESVREAGRRHGAGG